MGTISGFTVALPFLLIILVYMVKQHELNHIITKRKTELTILSNLFAEALKSNPQAAADAVRTQFINGLKNLKADGKLSETTCEIISAGLSNRTEKAN